MWQPLASSGTILPVQQDPRSRHVLETFHTHNPIWGKTGGELNHWPGLWKSEAREQNHCWPPSLLPDVAPYTRCSGPCPCVNAHYSTWIKPARWLEAKGIHSPCHMHIRKPVWAVFRITNTTRKKWGYSHAAVQSQSSKVLMMTTQLVMSFCYGHWSFEANQYACSLLLA